MSMIRPSDPDFRICLVDFTTLIEIQSDAERLGFATRWTSVDALRGQAEEQADDERTQLHGLRFVPIHGDLRRPAFHQAGTIHPRRIEAPRDLSVRSDCYHTTLAL